MSESERRRPVEGYELSPEQRVLWQRRSEALDPRLQIEIGIQGRLDPSVLVEALGRVVARHEILRTAFEPIGTLRLPVQVIQAPGEVRWTWEQFDLRKCGEAEISKALDAVRRRLRATPLRLDLGGVGTAALVRLEEERWILLLDVSELCADEATASKVLLELMAALSGEVDPKETIQFADYSEWLRERRAGDEKEAGRTFWLARRRDASVTFSFQEIGGRPAAGEVTAHVPVRSDVLRKLHDAARGHGAALADALTACFLVWWRRISGDPDATIWIRLDGRRFEELASVVGPMTRWVPAGSAAGQDGGFAALMRQLVEEAAEAAKWQEFVPDDDHWRGPGRAGEPVPSFEFISLPRDVQAGAVTLALRQVLRSTLPGELRLVTAAGPDGLTLEIHADAAVVGASVAGRIGLQIATLIESAAEDPDRLQTDLRLLSEQERRELDSFHRPLVPIHQDRLLHELIADQAARTPTAPAVVYGDDVLDYAGLDRAARALAARLRELGVKPDTLVGICLERSTRMVVAVVATLAAGGAYVPLDPGTLNPGHAAFPRERLAFMLEDTGVSVLITERHLVERLPAHRAALVCVDDPDLVGREDPGRFAVDVRPHHLAYAIYTSGSTGRPKAVLIEHRSVLNLLEALERDVYCVVNSRTLRLSLNAPLGFDPSVQQLVMLARGHTIHVVPEGIRANGRAMCDFVRAHRLNVLDCTPAQLRLLLAEGLLHPEAHVPDLLIVGGEALDRTSWRALAEADRTRGVNVYGPTECTVDATCEPIQDPEGEPTIGRPMLNTEIYLLDLKGNRVPIGSAGEIHVAGTGVARAYLNRPELTAERFLPNPFNAAAPRMYRTGDLARYRSDGRLEFLGRRDHQIKVRGHRIELGELEHVLSEHPEVREAVAAVLGDGRLAAYVVPRGQEPTTSALVEHLRRWVPDYMIPAAFVCVSDLPLTANGKVDRKALPAPRRTRPSLDVEYVAPRSEIEQRIARIWSEVLELEEIGVKDDFFDLGGHSLLAVRLIERLEELVGEELPSELYSDVQTIEQQAAGLAERGTR